jgi:tRNA(Ile)-lysidine synthetase-like protein
MPSATSAPTVPSPSTLVLLRRVQESLAPYRESLQGKRLLLAVSGGPDSMALLYVCRILSSKYDWSLGIAHVNYELRAGDSDADEQLVRTASEVNQIPLSAYHPKQDLEDFKTDENTLRDIRYGFFHQIQDSERYDYIVTGHTLSDQVETVLMRLIRGTGIHGVQGMEILNSGILRPLLCLTRADIMELITTESLAYRIDESNADPKYLRNRVRHELIPLLTSLNPQAQQHILDLSRDMATLGNSNQEAPEIVKWTDRGSVATFALAAWQGLESGQQKVVLDQLATHFQLGALRRTQIQDFQQWLASAPEGGSALMLGRLNCHYKHGILECRLP